MDGWMRNANPQEMKHTQRRNSQTRLSRLLKCSKNSKMLHIKAWCFTSIILQSTTAVICEGSFPETRWWCSLQFLIFLFAYLPPSFRCWNLFFRPVIAHLCEHSTVLQYAWYSNSATPHQPCTTLWGCSNVDKKKVQLLLFCITSFRSLSNHTTFKKAINI